MHMVRGAADDDRRGIVVTTNAAEVRVEVASQFDVLEKGRAVFRGINDVHINLRERLRHGHPPTTFGQEMGHRDSIRVRKRVGSGTPSGYVNWCRPGSVGALRDPRLGSGTASRCKTKLAPLRRADSRDGRWRRGG